MNIKILLLLGMIFFLPSTYAAMYCNGEAGKGICCIQDMVNDQTVEVCYNYPPTCNEMKPPPNKCNFPVGSAQYCQCKAMQSCNDACGVYNTSDWNAGAAVNDMHKYCKGLVEKINPHAFRHLDECKKNTSDYNKQEQNCEYYVTEFCKQVHYVD